MKRMLSRGNIQQLHELGLMKDKGILTADEFAALKVELLENHRRGGTRGPVVWIAATAVAVALVIAAFDTTSGSLAAHGRDAGTTAARTS